MSPTRPRDAFDATEAFVLVSGGDVTDPYPDLARLRHETPIARATATIVEEGESDVPVFTLYRYDDVETVLRDGETFSSRRYGAITRPVMGRTMLEMDPPEHTGYRRLVQPPFLRSAMPAWEERVIRPKVSELVDGFAGRGHAELMRELAVPFPVQVIAAMLGLPTQDYPRFLQWAMALISWTADTEGGIRASRALTEYFAGVLEERRAQPRDDLVSDLAFAEIDGARLDDEEVFAFLRLLLPAGAETTARSLGNLLVGLFRHPDQLELLRDDPTLVDAAIEESLRWECPLLFVQRSAIRDCEVGGVEMPAGSILSLCLGSANRDETHFDDPDRFDITRPAEGHFALGGGPHLCLGRHLARAEMRVAVEACLERLPALRPDPGEAPPVIKGFYFRSPPVLPVAFDLP